ncbi:acetyl-CoA C-acetyltransferase [Paenibacillus chondroitinus]|uniref:acetyl-CoA C-acetyltransferase n=1 Tax=Paenibacillus chondroitinus TaxID=59842 RepID=A0ABU6DKB4_9BACL|nr:MULTISPECIES: acetyl-CoA C-acetyltransferase [Paenibacillus]MCY9660614.1 acetyl-CoA C-acetyltransferase [Paenibacillus anseongense]MEB4798206.1 acetyl-CoA C-acetyltransferase [Paenibacillus chondroitinus]
MKESVIVGGARTPFGKFGGGLKDVPAVELGGTAIREAIRRSSLEPSMIEGVIMGMVLQGGAGQNPARQAARLAGLGWGVTAETINKVCASGLRSVTLADQMIRSGDADCMIAGGMESMSSAPFLLPSTRWGARMGNQTTIDLMVHDGLLCPFEHVQMFVHGSNVAAEFGLSRDRQDEWALRSHVLAIEARKKGYLAEEIAPVVVQSKQGAKQIEVDEGPRTDTSMEKLAALPALVKGGTITAGNAPGVNDGATAMAVMSKDKALACGVSPLATIVGSATVGERAPYIATTPALAIQKLLRQTGIKLDQISRFEVNEAFAAVLLTTEQMLGWNPELVNVGGGAIALGHPIGASGTRIVLTLIHELRRSGGGYGIAAICSGAAQGDAILIRVDG